MILDTHFFFPGSVVAMGGFRGDRGGIVPSSPWPHVILVSACQSWKLGHVSPVQSFRLQGILFVFCTAVLGLQCYHVVHEGKMPPSCASKLQSGHSSPQQPSKACL